MSAIFALREQIRTESSAILSNPNLPRAGVVCQIYDRIMEKLPHNSTSDIGVIIHESIRYTKLLIEQRYNRSQIQSKVDQLFQEIHSSLFSSQPSNLEQYDQFHLTILEIQGNALDQQPNEMIRPHIAEWLTTTRTMLIPILVQHTQNISHIGEIHSVKDHLVQLRHHLLGLELDESELKPLQQALLDFVQKIPSQLPVMQMDEENTQITLIELQAIISFLGELVGLGEIKLEFDMETDGDEEMARKLQEEIYEDVD